MYCVERIELLMKMRVWFFLLLIVLLSSCSQSPDSTATLTPQPTATLSQPGINTTSVPDPGPAAEDYLDAWQVENYQLMYDMLTSISQDAILAEDFEQFYRGIASEAALSDINYEILSSLVLDPTSAQVSFRMLLDSVLVGELQRDTLMNLTLEDGEWRVQWDDALVLPELAGGNYLGMERYIPSRANIYDREGHALVAQADATAIGLRPAVIDPGQEEDLFTVLTSLTGLSSEAILAKYENFPIGADWYLPLGEVPADEIQRRFGDLSGFSGLVLNPYKSRYYFEGGIAPHIVGYVSQIQAGEEEEYLRQGYRIDERVGQAGIEYYGEGYLSGKRGGALYLFNPQGELVTKLAETQAEPAQAVYTTLNKDFQLAAQKAMEGYRGAAIVLERDTGRVLAIVSSPGFDPNAFEPTNYNYYSLLTDISENPYQPLLNRATQGQYPLGSVFKIITLAAGLESGRFTPQSTYQCGYFFDELDGVTLHDWTYDHYLEDGKTIPSGLLTLPEGLIRSCNPYFWHIGLTLFNEGLTTAVADMAKGFGLGAETGIEYVNEAGGNIPEPASQVDATNLAIGQGDTLVTPLQVAVFTAALGNGGTLYRPQVVESILSPDGEEIAGFEPEVVGELPVSPENLEVIQDAMRGVVASSDPYGTAWHRFTGLDIPVAGKTGTAQSGFGDPHAWFTGYTFAERENKPDIAVVVVMENAGEGSDFAAPVFRRLVELYFYDRPAKLYPWESGFYVTRTPTPEFEEGTE